MGLISNTSFMMAFKMHQLKQTWWLFRFTFVVHTFILWLRWSIAFLIVTFPWRRNPPFSVQMNTFQFHRSLDQILESSSCNYSNTNLGNKQQINETYLSVAFIRNSGYLNFLSTHGFNGCIFTVCFVLVEKNNNNDDTK